MDGTAIEGATTEWPGERSRYGSAGAGLLAAIDPAHPRRAEVEAFIRQRYREAYGACLGDLMPQLCARVDQAGTLIAAAGLRLASQAPLFLERYLDAPIEDCLRAHFGVAPARERIVEIGHLSGAGAGATSGLFVALARELHASGIEWAVFVATSALRQRLARIGLQPRPIAAADAARLGPAAERWGSYYATDPWLLAGPLHWAGHLITGAP